MTDAPIAAQSGQLLLLDSEPGRFAYYLWKNILIVIWFNQGTGRAVQRLETVVQTLVVAHPEGISNIHIIIENAPAPTAEARAGFGKLIKQFLRNIACSEIVVLGGGFRASTMRAAITGIKMIAPRSFPFRIHSTVAEAVRMLSFDHPKRTGVHIDHNELIAVLEAARTPRAQRLAPETKEFPRTVAD